MRLYLLLVVVAKLVIDVRTTKIVQGIRAEVNEHPFSVWIQYNGTLVCGGSLVDTKWILTLAQCMSYSDLSLYRVVIGDRLINKEDGEVTVQIDKVVKHPGYNETSGMNNVALVYLSGEADISLDNIGLVPLMNQSLDEIIEQKSTCVLSGFGTRGEGRPSNFKLKLDVFIQPDAKCSNSDAYSPDLNICYQAQGSDGKACTGDEGSPVVCEIDGKLTQIGINIQGNCKSKRMTGMQISAYFDWIMSTIAAPPKIKITLDDVFSGKYSYRSFRSTWDEGEEALYGIYGGSLWKYYCANNTWDKIIDRSLFPYYPYSYKLSADKNYALVGYDPRYLPDIRVVLQGYWILDMNTKEVTDLEGPSGVESQAVSWAPTGSALAFVQGGDIFLRKRAVGRTIRLTNTGDGLEVLNGISGWLFGAWSQMFWSPNGRSFLYYTSNYTNVQEYDLTIYGNPNEQYVQNERRPYMKTGTAILTTTVTMYDVSSGETYTIDPPDVFKDTDYYMFDSVWQDERNVLSKWVSRIQDHVIYTLCDAETGSCNTNYEIKPTTGPVITRFQPSMFTPDGKFYFMLLADSSTEARHIHIAMINANKQTNDYMKKTTFITTGMYDVESILSYDHEKKVIYYIAFAEGDTSIKRLYRTTTNRKDPEFRKPVCMSCFGPDTCEWVTASFSYSSSFYILNCQGPDVPTYTLWSTTSGMVRSFEDNERLREFLKTVDMPKDEYLRIPLDGNQTMSARMLIPSSYTGDNGKTYDLANYVYGGPESLEVTKRYGIGIHNVMASSYNMVVGFADGRGTMGRGETWIHAINRKLGTLETDDAITAARYFKSLDFVSDNAGIYGGSYGGFNTLMALARSPDVFKCGVSFVPVTDWKYYYSAYTEAYMSTPQDNPEGYEFSTLARYAENFKQSRLLIMDATGDDNVHYQNTAQFTKALVAANVHFEMMAYTDNDHSLRYAAKHFRELLMNFMRDCLKKPPPSIEPEEENVVPKNTDLAWENDHLLDEFGTDEHSSRYQIPKF